MSRAERALRGARAAVVTMEIQRGIVGDLANIPDLAKAVADAELVANTARLVRAAREAGMRVIHCTAAFREDRAGSFRNVPMVNALLERPDYLVSGSAEAELVPELGPAPEDLVNERLHGMTPFTGTSLDAMLRSDGVDTVIAAGVSLNVGIIGLVVEAIGHGYQVVVPTDCVVGFPLDYGEQIVRHSLSLLATLTSADEIAAAWGTSG